ncbi:hypothetical protein N7510_008829 [Penicillium lagena]|uniref:uncharacterized protein n=1 Tax=Penicillium lagena TaxID=94218 RepID=UPI0025408289|nr:uncharacterized protein N7510_008829 [Penicillium lagena]KAJ5606048.1 hypothetical protein N7510_008829 [Penicillium lagena]
MFRKRYHEELARLQKRTLAIHEVASQDGEDAELKSTGSTDQASELEVTMSAPRHGDCAASTTSYQTAHSFLSPSTTTPTSPAFHTPIVHLQTPSVLDISEEHEPSSILENPTSTGNIHTSPSQGKSPQDIDHGTSIMEAISHTPGNIYKNHDIHPSEEKQQHDHTSIPDLLEESNIQAEQTETSTNIKPFKQFTDLRKESRTEPTTQPADSNLKLEQRNTNDEESQSDTEVSITTATQAGEEPESSMMFETKPLSKKAKIKKLKKSRKRRFRGKKHRASDNSPDNASKSDTETDEESEHDEAADSPRASQVQFETSHLAPLSETSPGPSSAIKKGKGTKRISNILIPVLQKSSTATEGPSPPSDPKTVPQGQDLVREDRETRTTPTLTASPEEATPSSTTTLLATRGDDAPTCSPSRGMGLSQDKPNAAGGYLIIQTPPGFVWELTSVSFPCAKIDCRQASNLWDGQSVICPKCGPYSLIRYCGRDHLREDVSQHWNHCDKYSFQHPCVPGSVPPEVLSGSPQLPCRHRWDSPERHRQAMLFSTARREDSDYVLFAEWPLATAAGGDSREYRRRCSPQAFLAVRWADPVARDRFRRVLAICLFSALEVQPLVGFMFRLVRDNLHLRGLWSVEVDHMLRSQIRREHGVSLQPPIKGQHHASEAEWVGLDTRSRRDPTYVNDIPLLGSLGGGFRRLCDLMESRFWILRASRTTHPFVQSVDARTRGEGFVGVRGEERRTFRRGEGWDGAGTGPLELEAEP